MLAFRVELNELNVQYGNTSNSDIYEFRHFQLHRYNNFSTSIKFQLICSKMDFAARLYVIVRTFLQNILNISSVKYSYNSNNSYGFFLPHIKHAPQNNQTSLCTELNIWIIHCSCCLVDRSKLDQGWPLPYR